MPSSVERITFLQMTWTVSKDAAPSNAFYSPWFGARTPSRYVATSPSVGVRGGGASSRKGEGQGQALSPAAAHLKRMPRRMYICDRRGTHVSVAAYAPTLQLGRYACVPKFPWHDSDAGMDPADNLNLIQPVNPWSGRDWSMCAPPRVCAPPTSCP